MNPFDVGSRPRGKVQVAENNREQIIEVMSDAAGDSPEGLQCLRLLKKFLDAAPLCNVRNDTRYADRRAVLGMVKSHSPGRVGGGSFDRVSRIM